MDNRKKRFVSEEEFQEIFERFVKRWKVDFKTAEKDFWTIYNKQGKYGVLRALKNR